MPNLSQSVVAENHATVKNVVMIGENAVIQGPIIINGDPADSLAKQMGGGYGPHVEFDRAEQWTSVTQVLAAQGYDCLFLAGEREQAHKQFALRLWGHLEKDRSRRIRARMVGWGLQLTRDEMRKALARSLEIEDARALPDDAAVARALQVACAEQPLVLIHTSVHVDEQGPKELDDLAWYYREHLPALISAGGDPGARRGQLVVLQPIEWTPGLKNLWTLWGLTPRARIHGLIERLRRQPPRPFKINNLPRLRHIPDEDRQLLLPDFLKRFGLRGAELDEAVARIRRASTTQKLFEALEGAWLSSQWRTDGRVQ